MVEEIKKQGKQEQKIEKKVSHMSLISKEIPTGKIIRIMQTDIPGTKTLYAGLTRIKGISWAISNVICLNAKINKNKKIEDLTKEEIVKVEETIKKHDFPKYLLNRRNDFATGESSHVIGSDIDMNEELDIKRLKKIRSFRGWRHATGQPTRGQSTRSHFRTNRKKGVGIKSKIVTPVKAKGE
jgi:small subunit ribosomal protein S13